MEAGMIRCKIDCLKIAKEHIFVGQKGKYIDITLIETPNDKFGNDYMVVQDVGKEARLAGTKGAILGNAKIVGQRPAQAPAAQTPPTATSAQDSNAIPF